MINWQFCNFFTTFTYIIDNDTTTKKAKLCFVHANIFIPFFFFFGLFLDDVGKSFCAWYGGHNAIVLELTNQIIEANELM
jgi:hypothetical protein